MTELHETSDLRSFDYESFETYDSCLLGKMIKMSFSGKESCTNNVLELIHIDVCNPNDCTC